MAISDEFKGLPEVEFDGPDGAHTIWYRTSGQGDWEHGMIAWNGQRFWFGFSCYDQDEEAVRYSVYPLTPEEARILDDWYAILKLLGCQWGMLAEDPATAAGIAFREKTAQLEAFASTLPRFESKPIVAYFSASDYGPAGKPKTEGR